METVPQKCTVMHVIISPSEIHILRFILEAYEGIALITTLDPALGLVQISIAPGCEQQVDQILEAEAAGLKLRHVTRSETADGKSLET